VSSKLAPSKLISHKIDFIVFSLPNNDEESQ
jgi:hypothetical protein